MSWRDLRVGRWLSIVGVRRWQVGVSVALAFAVAGLEGVSLGLLVPIAVGVTQQDFAFVRESWGFSRITEWFPGRFDDFAALFFLVAAVAFGAAVLKNVLSYGAYLFAHYWYGQYRRAADDFVFERALRFGKLYYDRASPGAFRAVLGYTGEFVDLLNVAQKALVTALTLLAHLAVMLWISWRLTIFVLCFFPVLHLASRTLSRRIEGVSRELNEETLAYHAQSSDLLSILPLIRASSEETTVHRRYAQTNETLRRINFRISTIQGLLAPFQEIVTLVALLALSGFLAFYVADKQPAELAVFLVFFFAARSGVPMFTALQEARATAAAKKPMLEELGRLLEDDDKHIVPDGEMVFSGLESEIRVRDLHYAYEEERPVLRGVDACFPRGAATALVGPTGAGKSTLIHLLMGFYEAPLGSIQIDGHDLRRLDVATFRRRVALVTQEVFLSNDTLRANLSFGIAPPPTEEQLADALRRARLESFVEGLPAGLDAVIGDRGVQLSGGEKQRVAICRALLRDAEILILDEATSSLDAETEALVQEAIEEAVSGRTSIVIAHRLSTIRRADRILFLEDGRVAEEGTLDDLLARAGRFSTLWRAQGFS